MKRLLIVLTLALAVVSVSVFGHETIQEPDFSHLSVSDRAEAKRQVKRFTAEIRSEIEDGRMDTIARVTDRVIEHMVNRGLERLEAAGDREGAHFHRFLFNTEMKGYLTRMVAAQRGGYMDIGDHPEQVLSTWLRDFYERLELILGVTICKATHLSDIKSINSTVKIVFKPCSFEMDLVSGERIDEYRRHFNAGEVYYGLVPVAVWWLVDVPLLMTPAAMFAGTIASAVQFGISKTVGPKLSDLVYTKSCDY